MNADTNAQLIGIDAASGPDITATSWAVLVRPAIISATHPKQRYFGASREAAEVDLADRRGAAVGRARVFRFADDDFARVQIQLGQGSTAVGVVELDMAPAAMRELARCLIDAAADIEDNPASAWVDQAEDQASEGAQ